MKKIVVYVVLVTIILMKGNSSVYANNTNYFEIENEKVYYNKESEIPLYGDDGICGSVAAAIVFKYYDNYVDSRFIPANLESSNGEILIKALVPYIDGNSPGSTYGDIKFGMTQYMLKQNLVYKAGYIKKTIISSPWNKITSTIKNDMPVIVGLSSESPYNEHWVVCTGYLISSDAKYLYINDGWGNVDVCINYNYVDGTVYIH